MTRRHTPAEIEMRIDEERITTKRVVNYLGISLDTKMTFWPQIQHAATKAAKATASLSKLMANIGGPIASKRKLLMAVKNAILLYRCEIWADALSVKGKAKQLLSVQRTAALKIASAYRTVSGAAVLVIAGVIPIDLLAIERRRKWRQKSANRSTMEGNNEQTTESTEDPRRSTIHAWQTRWNTERRGRWTARMIPNLEEWVTRKTGEVNYYLTQMLSGHGYFRMYLHKMEKGTAGSCLYGDSDCDDAEHTFFVCQKWIHLREELHNIIGTISPENIVTKMLKCDENWKTIATYVEVVLKSKKKDMEAQERQP